MLDLEMVFPQVAILDVRCSYQVKIYVTINWASSASNLKRRRMYSSVSKRKDSYKRLSSNFVKPPFLKTSFWGQAYCGKQCLVVPKRQAFACWGKSPNPKNSVFNAGGADGGCLLFENRCFFNKRRYRKAVDFFVAFLHRLVMKTGIAFHWQSRNIAHG